MPVAGAAIGAAGIIGGAIAGSKGNKASAKISADTAQKSLEEQRRIYEIESKKEDERYRTERADKEYDRNKTLRDEQRIIASRQGAFGGFGGDLSKFSQGYAAPYGMSAEQAQGLMSARNAGFSGGGGSVAPVQPQMGDPGLRTPDDSVLPPTDYAMSPSRNVSAAGASSGAFGSTVWLQAPTGEVAEVPLQDAPKIQQMLQDGAVLIPAPRGGPS